jgi:F0F1-type ATP synthase membrane subunit c/vacuolar-type H+-ATPase subunit K
MDNMVNRMLWWSLVMSLLVYVLVANVARVPPSPDLPIGLLTAVLFLLSCGIGAGTVIHRRRALSGPIQSGALDPTTPAGAQKAFTPFILNLVLSESVGIFGLVLSLFSGNPLFCAGFSAAAIALMVVHRPTASDLVPPLGPRHRASNSTPIS